MKCLNSETEIDKFVSEIIVVTVSYGERSDFIIKLVNRLIELKITKIIIVDNNMSQNSKIVLSELNDRLGQLIEILHFETNVGSAKAFKLGLMTAARTLKHKYVLMLDDDNLPELNIVKVLHKFWLDLNTHKGMTALACNRLDFAINERAVARNEPWLLLGEKNSFLGFRAIDVIKILCNKIITRDTTNYNANDSRFGKVYFAPYGGLFFHMDLLNVIGYPNENYVVYADDCEFSYRITLNGGTIYALLDANIYDMDGRGSISEYGNIFNFYANHYDKIRTYYTLRNAIHFHLNYYSNNKLVFILNLVTYYSICLLYVLLNFNYGRISVFFDSFVDGILGKLGQPESYNLSKLDGNLS